MIWLYVIYNAPVSNFAMPHIQITGFPALSIPGLIWVAMQGILEEKPGQSSL